jgi:hypothetical protein
VRILDTRGVTVRVVDPVPPASALLVDDGIVALEGTTLISLPSGAGTPERIGTVPERTHLLAALSAGETR